MGQSQTRTTGEIEDLLLGFAEELLKLPLAERLTAAERETIRQIYADTYPDDIDRSLASIRVGDTLETLFGKGLFNPETE